ncbi:MAG: hypothetical protein R3C69_11165 [Geminicoccaceae bacterium]
MLQNPYGQGYIGLYAMDLIRQGCTMKEDAPWQQTAQTAHFIDSGTAFVDADKVKDYQAAMVAVTDEIMATSRTTSWSATDPWRRRRPGEAGRGPGLLASNEVGLALLIAVLVAIFATVNPGFTSPFNLFALSRVMGIDMVIGLSMMVVLVTGGLNLAVGSIGVASVMLGGWAMQVAGVPVLPSMTLAIAFGAFLGWINGQLTVDGGAQLHRHAGHHVAFFGAMIVATKAEAFNALPRSFVDLGKLRYGGFVAGMLPLALPSSPSCSGSSSTAPARPRDPGGRRQPRAELSGVRVNWTDHRGARARGALGALAGPCWRRATVPPLLHGRAYRHGLAVAGLPRPGARAARFDRR